MGRPPYTTIEDELHLTALPGKIICNDAAFITWTDLTEVEVYGKSWGKEENFRYLLRIAYTWAIQQGNILSYLRILVSTGRKIWD